MLRPSLRKHLGLRAGLAALALLVGRGGAAAQGLDPTKALTQYDLDVWTTADELPQNSITAIVQTRDGYLWIGTYGGLVRFDGVRFTVFDRANTEALRSNGIQALLADRDGALWVGTNGGGLLHVRNGLFTAFTTADGLGHDIVRVLHQDRGGTVWAGTNDGLSRWDGGRFTTFRAKDGLSHGIVRAIEEDTPGALWVGTNGGGLDRLENGRLRPVAADGALPSKFVFALRKARDGALWIGTNGGGLSRLAGGRLRTFTTSDGLPSNIVWSIHEDAQGSLWIGTYGGGLARLRDGRFAALGTREGLSNDFIRAVFADREGSLWIGTYSGGLCRLRDGKFTTYTSREGLGHDFARTVLEDADGALWVGTTGGGLCRMAGGVFRCQDAGTGLADDVRALYQSDDGALWVGTAGAGLFRLQGGSRQRYTTADGLPHQNVSAVCSDRRGGLWVGTNGGGLGRLAQGRWTTIGSAQGLASDFVLTMLVDRSGSLWAGTDGAGLSRYADGRFTTFTTRDGLAGDIVFALHEGRDGAVWIGTSGGLSRLKDGRLASVTTQDGLFDDVVFQVLEDDDGHFWLSGNKGISRVPRGELEAVADGRARAVAVVSYGVADGMKSSDCTGVAQPAGSRGRDGRLWFPTARGVVAVDPRRIPVNALVPPVKIEQVVVDGEPAKSLEFAPGHERWELQYTALTFLAPRKVQFRYRLEGFDADWVPAGTRRTAYYTRLPPGRYTFRVVAANNDGVWNEEGDAVELKVQPYVHQTGWFYALCSVGLMLSGAGVYALRVRSLHAHRRELESLVEARTSDLVREKEASEEARSEAERQKEIAEQADRLKGELLSIAAHDLKTPLQSIIGYADLIAEVRLSAEAIREYAGYSARAAERMLHIVNRLLQSDAIEQGHLRPGRDAVELGRLALAVASALGPLAEAKKQRIHAAAEDSCLVEGDEDWLRQVLENLIGNAIKYSPERRSIWLSVRRVDASVVLEVRDEGPGLTKADQAKLFGRFQRLSARPTGGESATGLGLSIVKQLVELHGGRVWAEGNGQEIGARFVVEIPATHRPGAETR